MLQNFKEVQVAYKVYKNVQSSKTTSYQLCSVVYDPPVASLVIDNNETVIAVAPYPDVLGILPVGKYTLKVFEDTTHPSVIIAHALKTDNFLVVLVYT